MENNKLSSDQSAALKKALVRRVIIIALVNLVVLGGLALVFYSQLVSVLKLLPLRQSINTIIPGLFDVGVVLLFTLLFSAGMVCVIMRRTFRHIAELKYYYPSKPLRNWENRTESFTDLLDKPDAAAEELRQARERENLDRLNTLQHNLESEQHLNQLLSTLIVSTTSRTADSIPEILSALGSYHNCDFAAIYNRQGESDCYTKLDSWDADPDLARHSNKIESIDLNLYRWMSKSLATGKPFIFRTAMLESLMDSVAGAAEDVIAWMRMQAQESAEHKLCKHEGWEYVVCFPCFSGKALLGLFLIGYQKSSHILSGEALNKLSQISGAIGSQLLAPAAKAEPATGPDYLQTVLEPLDDVIFTTDTQGNITRSNYAAEKISGLNRFSIKGRNWQEVFSLIDGKTRQPVADPVAVINRATEGKVHLRDLSLQTPEGNEIQLEGMAAAIKPEGMELQGIVFILQDITDKIKAENERSQAQKMEAISTLSSGLAHDFNNILTAILGNISLALDDAPPNSEQAAVLKAAEESTLKGKQVTNNLLALAKGSPVPDYTTEVPVPLEALVNKLLAGTNVKPIFQMESNLPSVRMSRENFNTIITNVVSNALQAMKQGGMLSVSVKSYDARSEADLPLQAGKYVCIQVKDTGEGIPIENQNRVFVPYFTTHPPAAGMGLPVTYSLLKKHDGYIRLQSQPGKGTTCEIFIPASLSAQEAKVEEEKSAATPLVMVLDEDDALGNLLVKTMVKMGLKVQKTTDADELSTMFFQAQHKGSPVKLVLADLNMPAHVSVPEMLSIFKKSDPRVKVIAYSNLLQPEDREVYKQRGFDDVLPKPFNITDLRQVIYRNI